MPAELLSPVIKEAIESAAEEIGLNPPDAVLLIERLVVEGHVVAGFSPSLSPEAEGRLALSRFRDALPPHPPDPPPAEPEPTKDGS